MGLGKTFVAINIARYWIQKGIVNKILVMCPTTIMRNWKMEIDKFSEYSGIEITGTLQERIKKLTLAKDKFHILNYEVLWKLRQEIHSLKYDMIIFDESSRFIKNPAAKRTKAALALSDFLKRSLILTGTPITNRPLDLWAQMRVLDNGKAFGSSFGAFKKTYFHKIKRKYKNKVWYEFKLRPDKIYETKKNIFSVCIQRRKREVLKDLPEVHYRRITIPMSDSLKKIYLNTDRVVRQEIYEMIVQGKVVTIKSVFTKLLRLKQVTSGFTNTKTGEKLFLEETPKLDALINEVESIVDAEESVIIWCEFLTSIEMIESRLKKKNIKCITMSGKDKDKYSKWKGFQKSDVPVFIGQIRSGGIGIELMKLNSNTKMQHMIYYENPWTPDERTQSEGRIDRLGQTAQAICYTDIVVDDSIDLKLLESLQGKQDIINNILGKDGGLKLN